MNTMGCGRKKVDSVLGHAASNTLPVHGNIGKASSNNQIKPERTANSLHIFFISWTNQAVPTATRLVRTETGLLEAQDADDESPLPSPVSLHSSTIRPFCTILFALQATLLDT